MGISGERERETEIGTLLSFSHAAFPIFGCFVMVPFPPSPPAGEGHPRIHVRGSAGEKCLSARPLACIYAILVRPR